MEQETHIDETDSGEEVYFNAGEKMVIDDNDSIGDDDEVTNTTRNNVQNKSPNTGDEQNYIPGLNEQYNYTMNVKNTEKDFINTTEGEYRNQRIINDQEIFNQNDVDIDQIDERIYRNVSNNQKVMIDQDHFDEDVGTRKDLSELFGNSTKFRDNKNLFNRPGDEEYSLGIKKTSSEFVDKRKKPLPEHQQTRTTPESRYTDYTDYTDLDYDKKHEFHTFNTQISTDFGDDKEPNLDDSRSDHGMRGKKKVNLTNEEPEKFSGTSQKEPYVPDDGFEIFSSHAKSQKKPVISDDGFEIFSSHTKSQKEPYVPDDEFEIFSGHTKSQKEPYVPDEIFSSYAKSQKKPVISDDGFEIFSSHTKSQKKPVIPDDEPEIFSGHTKGQKKPVIPDDEPEIFSSHTKGQKKPVISDDELETFPSHTKGQKKPVMSDDGLETFSSHTKSQKKPAIPDDEFQNFSSRTKSQKEPVIPDDEAENFSRTSGRNIKSQKKSNLTRTTTSESGYNTSNQKKLATTDEEDNDIDYDENVDNSQNDEPGNFSRTSGRNIKSQKKSNLTRTTTSESGYNTSNQKKLATTDEEDNDIDYDENVDNSQNDEPGNFSRTSGRNIKSQKKSNLTRTTTSESGYNTSNQKKLVTTDEEDNDVDNSQNKNRTITQNELFSNNRQEESNYRGSKDESYLKRPSSQSYGDLQDESYLKRPSSQSYGDFQDESYLKRPSSQSYGDLQDESYLKRQSSQSYGDFQDKNYYKDNNFPSSGYNRANRQNEFFGSDRQEFTIESNYRGSKDESYPKKQNSGGGFQGRQDEVPKYYREQNDETKNQSYGGGDEHPSSGYNPTNKKDESPEYYGGQNDETKKQNNQSGLQGNYYKDNESSSSEYNRTNRQNEFIESYYGGQNDKTKKQNNQMHSSIYGANPFDPLKDDRKSDPEPGVARWLLNKLKPSNNKNVNEVNEVNEMNEIRVIFHVHLPDETEKIGKPVILGSVKELGSWTKSIVKFRQPFPRNKTYWQSDPVTISLSSVRGEIQYKYAIHVTGYSFMGRDEKVEYEGKAYENRTLDIQRNDQFDIWQNNNKFRIYRVPDFAFVDYIYNSIDASNLKDKVMEYQHLLVLHNDATIRASNLDFIGNRVDNKLSKDKRLFLCLLLGYYTSRKQGSSQELQGKFPSGLLLKAFEDYRQETSLPSNTKDQICIAIKTLVQHNASLMQYDWLIIFQIAAEIDPKYTFIDRLKSLKYTNDNSLIKLIDGVKVAKPYIEGIELETYAKIAKWLIQLCHNMDSLFRLWINVLSHNNKNNELDNFTFRFFIEQAQENVSHYDNAVALENQFKRLPQSYRPCVAEVFRSQALFLLEGSNRKWSKENIEAVKNLLREDSLKWNKDDVIQSLDLISQTNTLELLNTFPELLDDWFRGEFTDKEKRIPRICIAWFKNLLIKLDTSTNTSTNNRKSSKSSKSNEGNVIFLVFIQLVTIHPLLSNRKNIWQNLTTTAIERVRQCSESQIFGATKFLAQIQVQEIRMLFLEMIKEILSGTAIQINEQLINKLFIICDCNGNKNLEVKNSLSEDILLHIMIRLQSQSSAPSASEYYLNILGASRFWKVILNASGNVAKLHSNQFVQRAKMSINELSELLREKAIDVQLLQQILEYSNEQLFQHFNAAAVKKKDVIISQEEIAGLRKLCTNYQLQLDVLFKFYNGFCSTAQDVNDYIQDTKQHMPNSSKVELKQAILPDYWAFHEKTLDSAKRCYKYNQSQSFRNIFDDCIQEDAAATNVEYIAKTLIPIVFEKYNTISKQFKDWEKLQYSDASLFWKNVTDVDVELNLMEGYKNYKNNKKFVQTLSYLSEIPQRIKRLEELKVVAKLFEVPHYDWLTRSITSLKDDSMKLSNINNFFDELNRNLFKVNPNCWKIIQELSNADKFIDFLKEIAEHDIKNLINSVDDHSDERFIQEDTVSSLIQVKQFLLPLMNKKDIDFFLTALRDVIEKNSTLGEKIALCNSSHMALRNMYKNISNRGEVTKEKIRNAVLNGTYTFARDEQEDKCSVSLRYTSKTTNTDVNMNSINEILDLRGRALLIAKPKMNQNDVEDVEMSKNVMDEFVVQVDIAQEIINVMSMLMQMGHFNYRKPGKGLQGIDKMRTYLKFLKDELEDWQDIVDRAQEQCYCLTFFPARHILAFYDYFTSEKLDEENEEECKTLIRFVNSKAQLPSHKDIQRISRESKDYFKILCEIGNELEKIFKNIPKQSRKLKAAVQHVPDSELVKKGELFVAACTDKTRVPNIIMSFYANHGFYPEPWQLLFCTSLTTMEELSIFIKRCFFASNNGYENHLFCIANLELLDFELQYDLVNQIRSMQDQKDYLLALICFRETVHHHILDQFSQYVHDTDGLNGEVMRGIYRELCQNVRRVSSDLSGQGKTEWIKEDSFIKKKIPRSFLISDGMDFGRLVRQFKECKLRPVESLHINIISADYPEDVNMFLFELLTLGIVSTNVDIACLPLSETPTSPTYIYIEIASTTEQYLLNSLPMAGYLMFNHLTWDIKKLKVSQEIDSPIQVTCNYLNLFDSKEIDTKEILFRTDNAIKEQLSLERCQYLIEKYFFNKDTKDISSFRFVEIFVNVLADQLVRLSSSQFFTVDNLKLMVKETNIRNLILSTFIDVSKDFATRSIKTKAAQLETIESISADDENARLSTIVRWDDSNHLIVFFNSQAPDTISALYRDRTKVHNNVKILLKSQVIGDRNVWELDDYNKISADALLIKLEYLARRSTEKLKLPQYALSGDNLIKMALILLRARSNIPVIVCGEAGCGKTSLIAYLALMVEVQFLALNLHAGIDETIIMKFMNDALKKAEEGEIWLFFDEINTCNHIGLLADLISHRILNGKLIHPNIRLFSACNPYRLRTKAQSEAGLTNKVKKYEERSKLVYQVKPLPDQILDYVWDYGILEPDDERKYIQIMVDKELGKLSHPVFAELLTASQKFIREVEEPYSVSLRDVKRAIALVKFFYTSLENRPPCNSYGKGYKYPPPGNPTIRIRSYVLALSLCYHSRLYEQKLRKKYRHEMGQILRNHKAFVGEYMFAAIIREEQEDYIYRMQCPPNTAHNEALLENVLVMIVCILTRIPLFLIGQPGSSKSLAVRLISSNLRGFDSNDEYFRKLPQVYLIPHQGSSSSTSDGIIKVFDKANKYQETTSKQFPVISVVLLDEVGLAETSPFNPLKVLHSLLEPSYPATGPTVSVIGISNWRLDNSKSSRALLVQRPQFDLDDLVDTAERLLSTKFVRYGQKGALKPLAKAYSDYERDGQTLPNFHGLRDYYALVKRLSSDEMTPENIQMALARNFGGAENNVKLCEKHFGNVLKMFNNHNPWYCKPIPVEYLVNTNLDDAGARHLMVIGKSDSVINLLTYQLRRRRLDPVVILGSKFPDDQEDYYYGVLRKIMMCVETGRPLILTNLENIYGSLYDLWNQNYIVVGSRDNVKYFTRVALGAYANPMLYVSPNFKCILVMDEKKVASADPPLLNRFEKQKMSIDDTLSDRQKFLVENLSDWARKMSTLIGVDPITQKRNKFTLKDLFIGFDQDETLQSLVIDATKNHPDAEDDEILERCKECLIATASPDGIVRTERSALEQDEVGLWKDVYFNQQHHDSLYDYFTDQKSLLADPDGHLVIVNTFSNINTDVKSCLQGLVRCQVDKLSTFKTEAQFSNRVKHFWFESKDQLLILQCDVTTAGLTHTHANTNTQTHTYTGCIKLAKFIIEQFRNEFNTKKNQETPMKHACIILHIHRDQGSALSTFNFMCGWKQMTIETLSNDISTSSLSGGSLSHIVDSTDPAYPFEKILLQELLWCLSCMKYPSNDKSVNHMKILNEKILEYPNLIKCLKERTLEWIEEQPTSRNWQYNVASNKQNLYPYPSFSIALQTHIRTLFKKPIARILCALERLSAIKTFFYVDDQTRLEENNDGLLKFWLQVYTDKKIVKIEDLQNPKPDGYDMLAGSLLDLEFPFSLYFIKQIDAFKRHYEEEIAILRNDDEKVDSSTNELYDYVVEEHLKDFKNNVLASFPQLNDSPFEWAPDLYFNDFVTIIATKNNENRNKKMLALILRLLIGPKKAYKPIFLHTYWWKNSNEVLALLQLGQMSPITIKNIETHGKSIIEESLEKYLVKEVIKMMFQRICGDNGSAVNAHLIDRWQHDVTKVLSLVNKITRARNLPDLQLLRIVNDLVSIKTISLDSIKEIVQFGSSSDEQEENEQEENEQEKNEQEEILSEKFVNAVLDKLDKLEQNEKNLIPKRSFIMRCLALIPIESDVRLNLYKKLFSNEPFPLMGAIIERIFLKEDEECEDAFFKIITNTEEVLGQSARLNIINSCLEDLDTNMATLCCDVIGQTFFNEELENLEPYFVPAIEALYRQGTQPLQKIVSIAFLKEFVRRFWDDFLQEDKNSPIEYKKMGESDFDSDELINLINNSMEFAHSLIYSLKIYFLRDLCRRDFSIDDIRKFCEAQKRILPWLESLDWEDAKGNRLPFNPYCYLPEYNELENYFITLYSIGNGAPFQAFIQNLKQNMTSTAKLSLIGLLFVRLHALRASREWQHSETHSSNFLTKELAEIGPDLFKTITTKILSNEQPLLQINNSGINNTDLILKSVIAHIIASHASVEPNSSQLAMYLHKLQDCQNLFILTCISDIESIVLNAVVVNEKTNTNRLTRYVCKCGYKYFIANCGRAATTGVCPECKNIIGGTGHESAPGNTMVDANPLAQLTVNDQAGYLEEPANQDLYNSVRSLKPTSYRILHLIVHALIGASAPQPALTFFQKNNNTAVDPEKYCMDHIQSDWEVLKNLLNCSDVNLALMFHSLISLMMENPPLPNQQLTTPAERDNWEQHFHTNYITPQIKNITETAANYRMKLSEALTKNQKNNLIEGEINQTLVMDKKYRSEKLPSLWRTIGIINFDSFRAYFTSDLTRSNDFPFLSIFFKYCKELESLKHLLLIVKFVQILNSKLGYQLTRQMAREMTFREFIDKESDNETYNIRTAFDDFKLGWNTVIPSVTRYQCHELPNDKPTMDYNVPVVFGLMENKDTGIFLCAILYHLVNIQNNFLKEVIAIPPGTCRSLKFLDEPLDAETVTSNSKVKPDTPNGYCLRSTHLDHARSGHIINFEWDDEILAYSQRNLAVGRGDDIVYDLTKIEAELANILVFEKVHIETQQESHLYLEPFPYHMELFQGCMRILSDIKNLITQEPIPIEKEKMNFLVVSGAPNLSTYPNDVSKPVLDNSSEILSSLEILLCFVKRTAVGDGDKLIKDYVSQWIKLSSLHEHSGFSKILNLDLQLKHLVSLYEFVEEQVANAKIQYIHEKYKDPLSPDMEAAILKSVDFEQQTTTKKIIPAEEFAVALKRFMLRFLTLENQKEIDQLYVYLTDSSLNFWSSTVPENLVDELFPENLLVANTYAAYEFIIKKIEKIEQMKRQANVSRNPNINSTMNQRTPPTNNSRERTTPRKGKKARSKFDAM